MKNEFNMKKSVNFAVQKNRRNMLEKSELINQILTRKKVNVFREKTCTFVACF
jgi:hypothetical protein